MSEDKKLSLEKRVEILEAWKQIVCEKDNEKLMETARLDSAAEEHKSIAVVKEENFSILKFEDKKGSRLSEYGIAYRNGNIPGNFDRAFNILQKANATISIRYHGEEYSFTYWLYKEAIYRQKKK